MRLTKALFILFFSVLGIVYAWAQCDQLSTNVSVDFGTDRYCAPVTVDTFKVVFNFLTPQNPAEISILYEWNDPLNSISVVDIGNGLVASAGNTRFTADAQFTYTTNNNQCRITPRASIVINGVVCSAQAQVQSAPFWSTDDEANGVVSMAPPTWDVCYDNPVVNAVFEDNSEFNCNPTAEFNTPNRLQRHVQFVYGTNHNPAATIRDLTLTDGGAQGLTNATGNLVSPTTRGGVTAGYFGPIDAIPFPADGPISVSFPMNAPANPANAIGNRFEVTMYNWNTCNPWNGSTANPNYNEARVTRGYIVIVESPAPAFMTEDALGNPTTDFCINERIFTDNLTPNINNYTYSWQFYNDAAGTILAGSSTVQTPSFVYSTGGQKLIRLRASNPTAQSPCIEEFTLLVNITPSLTAQIGLTDLSGNPISPDFCQEAAAPLTNFNVRFSDISTGTITANTRWRWEFYDQTNALIAEFPGPSAYSSTMLGPFDRVFTTPGIYRAVLITRDNITSCESRDEVSIRVFEKPQPAFTFDRVCFGNATSFRDGSTVSPIMAETISLREWDMDYDGVTFSSDPTLDNQVNFQYTFATAGSHRVALRVTTNQGNCSDIIEHTVVVDPLPIALFSASPVEGCSTLPVSFTNNSIAGQPDLIDRYVWEIDAGSGFQVDSIQRPGDPGFSNVFVRNFVNNGTTNITYDVRLRVVTVNDCEMVSTVQTITVYPGPRSGFISLNYSPFNPNCSPVSVNFAVDSETQSLNPSDYIWTVSDANGQLDQVNTGTTPAFTYVFNNTTQMVQDYSINLRTVLPPPSGCSGDSTRIIRVNPIPSTSFVIDTTLFDCNLMIIHPNAVQKGLVSYAWTIAINGVTVFSSSSVGDNFDYEITRVSGLDQNVDVTLVTTNLTNCPGTSTTNAIVVPQSNNVNADFTASPLTQTLPNSTVTLTLANPPGPWQYLWDFGDGTTSTTPNVGSHTYALYGTYNITLTVTDNDCQIQQTTQVVINPIPPVLDFEYFPPSGCAPLTVNFVNRSQFADPSTYFWEFGANQGVSHAVDPTYTYFQPGVYSVTLSATNASGDTVSITKSMIITVYESPVAQFAVYPKVLNIPGDILYTNNQSFGASNFIWDFGDGTTSTDYEPQHEYTEVDTFNIQLIAYNANGCADTARLESAVRTIRSGQVLIPNAFTPNLSAPGSTNLAENEVFLPLMRGVEKFHMTVFNRWGQLLFESYDPEIGWDGYYKGVLCQQDIYIYKITVEFEGNKQFTKTGDVTLIR